MRPFLCAGKVVRLVLAAAVLQACAGSESQTDLTAPIETVTLKLSAKSDTIAIGASKQLSAVVTNQLNIPVSRTVAWQSTVPSVATVNQQGAVTGIGAGITRIVASVGDKSDTATIIVRNAKTAFTVVPNVVSAITGDQIQFSLVPSTSAAAASISDVVWSTSNQEVASISSTGLLSAETAGQVVVTAQVGGELASASIQVKGTPVSSITLSPTNSTLNPGETTKIDAKVQDDNRRTLPGRKVTWSSSNTAVARVGSDGTVTAVAKGTAIITGEVDTLAATATVNVLATPVATISISLASSTIAVGQTTTATVTLLDASGAPLTGKTIAYQSSNSALATVNSNGVVTGVANGSVTISAISDGKIASAPLTIASLTASTIAISPTAPTAAVGQSAQLTAVVRDASGNILSNRPVTWSSSDVSIATISPTGLVTTIAVGSTTITAIADQARTTATFTVTSVPVATVVASPSPLSLPAGGTATLTATALSSTGTTLTNRTVTWSSLNPTVATVSNTGVVTAIAAGSTGIKATIEGVSATASVSVAQPPPAPVASVTIALDLTTVVVDGHAQATATLRDANGNVLTGRTVTWASANPSLATVSSSGYVTAVAAGTATITATAEGVTGAATLTITAAAPAPVATVQLTLSPTSITVGQTSTANVVLLDATGHTLSGRTVTWTSSNTAVALINASGVVTGVAAGTSTITATSEGKTGSATITVTSTTTVAPVASVTVTLTSSSLTVGQTTQATATMRDASGNVLSGRSVTWMSSNPTIATVSGSGVVSGAGAGSTSIVATSEGKQGSATVSVTAPTSPTPTTPPANFVESILGPLASTTTIAGLGGVWAQYERDFPTYDEAQWTQCGPRWDCIDYYDRAEIYYAWWKRTGDPKYLDRAGKTALDYRVNYLEANNYGIAHHWAMTDGVALHYLATGDLKSQVAVARMGENFAWQVNGDPSGYFTTPTDLRINAYAIKTLLDAWLIKAPSDGRNTAGWPAVPDWAPVLRSALTKILSLRDADGQWRTAKCTDGRRVSHPFTVGLLYDALVRYYQLFEADPRIPAAIKQSGDVMWRDDWIATSGAFKYVGESCGSEGTASPAADLNQLIVNGYAFVGKTMNDGTFNQRADQIFAGGVNGRGVTGDAKHFNQQYTSSYRYFSLR
jgi:uncharacterized protein YjdB